MRKVKCPYCGEKIEKNSRFCVGCGKALTEDAVSMNAEPEIMVTEMIDKESAEPKKAKEEDYSMFARDAGTTAQAEADEKQPEKENAEPGKENAEPGKENAEPEKENAEPGKENAEPETKNAGLEKENAEPETKNAEPEKENAEPETKNAEPEKENAGSETAQPETMKPGITEPEAAEPSAPEEQTGTAECRKQRRKASFGRNLASVILFVLAVVLAVSASLCFFVRNALSGSCIEQTVDNMTIGNVGVGMIKGQSADAFTLDEYMTEGLNVFFFGTVEEKEVRALLDEEFVKDFTADKLELYASDLLYNTGEGTLSAHEIISLFDDNWSTVKAVLGMETTLLEEIGFHSSELKNLFLSAIEDKMNKDINFDDYSLSECRKDNPVVFAAIRNLLSYPAIIVMAAVSLILLILIIVLNFRYRGGLRYAGAALMFVGVVDIAVEQAALVLPVVLNRSAGLGYDFYIAMGTGFMILPLIMGVGMLVLGIILYKAGKALRKKRKI